MIFESAYKEKLKTLLTSKTERKVRISNDVFFNPLRENAEGIEIMINSGNATKSSVPGYDFNTQPLMVTVAVQTAYLQELLAILNDVANEENAKLKGLLVEAATYSYKAVFNTPQPIGSPMDTPMGKGTGKASLVQWIINLTYSQNALIEPRLFRLAIDSTIFDMNYIYSYDMNSTPVNEAAQLSGASRLKFYKIARNNTYNFVFYRVTRDGLQDVLLEEMAGDTGGLYGKTLALTIDGAAPIEIKNYTVSESYVNNSDAITLTLMR